MVVILVVCFGFFLCSKIMPNKMHSIFNCKPICKCFFSFLYKIRCDSLLKEPFMTENKYLSTKFMHLHCIVSHIFLNFSLHFNVDHFRMDFAWDFEENTIETFLNTIWWHLHWKLILFSWNECILCVRIKIAWEKNFHLKPWMNRLCHY